MDVKIEFFDLNYLLFDTKHIYLGWNWSQMVHEAYLLRGQIEQEVVEDVRWLLSSFVT